MENEVLKQKVFKIVIPVIAVLALAFSAYLYNQVRLLKQDPKVSAQKEVSELVEKIGRIMVLPKGETPTVATVSDPEVLKDQPFFASAVKGDKVLIYAQAKKAILYSVDLDKIVEVAPLNIGNQGASSQSVSSPNINPDIKNTIQKKP
ncbi:MAG: hypothetical protein WCK91_02200 [bacterium]